jgi:hypothetical protein
MVLTFLLLGDILSQGFASIWNITLCIKALLVKLSLSGGEEVARPL